MTLAAPVELPIGMHQWRAQTLQLINWGGFEGYHRVDFDENATLISGGSGTGKSTLLDAHIALLMDSSTPFNTASNDQGTGRARSEEKRNVLSYMRGKTDSYRDDSTGQKRAVVLRGDSRATWSALGMTWVNSDGDTFTAYRAFIAPRGAERFEDLIKRFGYVDGAFDLRTLEGFVGQSLTARAIQAAHPQVKSKPNYGEFIAKVAVRLGIGAGGDAAKALKLLGRIQAGRQMDTVDELYKKLVLDRPYTYPAADKAREHFADLKRDHDQMRDAERQIDTLKDIPDLHNQYLEARTRLDLLDTIGLTQPHTAPTPFRLWYLTRYDVLLDDRIREVVTAKQAAHSTARELRVKRPELEREVSDLEQQIRDNGGEAIEGLERSIEALEISLPATRKARELLDADANALGLTIDKRQDLLHAHEAAAAFGAAYATKLTELETERDGLKEELWKVGPELRETHADLESLRNRTSNIPRHHHNQRLELAELLDVPADEIPFAGELIDMVAEYEGWRGAVSLALGGFALTVLIDHRHEARARRALDPLRWRIRLRYRFVGTSSLPEPLADAHTLPGRLHWAEHPFTGWVHDRLVRDFNYTCVARPEELEATPFGLTITGQVRERARGAHGGHGSDPVIGFSNEEQIRALEARQDRLTRRVTAIEEHIKEVEGRKLDLNTAAARHQRIHTTAWETVDVAGLEQELTTHNMRLDELLASADILTSLREQLQAAKAEHEKAIGDLRVANDQAKRLDGIHGDLVEVQEPIHDEIAAFRDLHGITLGDSQRVYLDTELVTIEPTPDADRFPTIVARLRQHLSSTIETVEQEANRAEAGLLRAFQEYQRTWPLPNASTTSVKAYPTYLEILTQLQQQGLHNLRAKWTRAVNQWSSNDLLHLKRVHQRARDEIHQRLHDVNQILATLSFGPDDDRIHIVDRYTETRLLAGFRQQLTDLASDATAERTEDEVEERFERLKKFMARLDPDTKGSERDTLLDVNRHIRIEAQRVDLTGRQLSVYTSLGDKSGGETQELVAFIVGAALRYQLGDSDLPRPRYAPVFLDEAFIKADSQYAGRALRAWKGLGFQLVIAAPTDKFTGIEPYVPITYQVTKNAHRRSHISVIRKKTTP